LTCWWLDQNNSVLKWSNYQLCFLQILRILFFVDYRASWKYPICFNHWASSSLSIKITKTKIKAENKSKINCCRFQSC
jgi:hypothetical protein